MYLRRSGDEGRLWGDAELCMPDRGYYVVNNDHCAGDSIVGRLNRTRMTSLDVSWLYR